MPEDLHEKLSEFSFGYGITRDIERSFEAVGLSTTPFFPNLRQEKNSGYDVKFSRRGGALLLQFKLGEQLVRYRKARNSTSIPSLFRPFWRFFVDTLETGGQFNVLFNAERSGCEVYYAAPRFTTWEAYAETFAANKVLESTLLIAPSDINERLKAAGELDGVHRTIYDQISVYIQSEPLELPNLPPDQLPQRVRHNIDERPRELSTVIDDLYHSFDFRRDKRVPPAAPEGVEASDLFSIFGASEPPYRQLWSRTREQRLQDFRTSLPSEADAKLAAAGYELWVHGIQMIAVTLTE